MPLFLQRGLLFLDMVLCVCVCVCASPEKKSYEQYRRELSQTCTALQRMKQSLLSPHTQPLLLEGECRQVDVSISGSVSNTAQLFQGL